MKTFLSPLACALTLSLALILSPRAEARGGGGCEHHLGIAAGLVHIDEPSETDFTLGAEYECRMNAFVGVGAFGDHVFSDPGFTILGAPQLLIHPLGGDFYVATSPILEFGDYTGTHLGLRLSTRMPLPVGLITLVPSFAVDFINSHTLLWFGLGIGF